MPSTDEECRELLVRQLHERVRREGFSICRATHADLRESGALDRAPRYGPVREVFIKPWDFDGSTTEEEDP
jgi:hypothetical protein